ncbi:MAG: Uncharacterized protein CEN90_697 [Parcubacteria group bacterium Licking1014_17]|nr:MAG: Uncharacterized protein CEN90_697 [Parcubacteria group bacterium Licking1014_17]
MAFESHSFNACVVFCVAIFIIAAFSFSIVNFDKPENQFGFLESASAYEASSATNFFIHGGGLTSVASSGQSTSYKEWSAGGQAIIGLASAAISNPALDIGENTISTTSSAVSTQASFQRKTWYDGSRYWAAFYDGADSIDFWYSKNGNSWLQNNSATISVATPDFSIKADSSNAYIVYTDGNDIKIKKAASYPATNFSWGGATTVFTGAPHDYPVVEKDTNNRIMVSSRRPSAGFYLVSNLSTNADDETIWDGEIVISDTAESNFYGVLAPLSGGNMLSVYVLYQSMYYSVWDGSSKWWGLPVSMNNTSVLDGLEYNMQVVSDPSAGKAYAFHGDSFGLSLVLGKYSESTNSWSNVFLTNTAASSKYLTMSFNTSNNSDIHVFWVNDAGGDLYTIKVKAPYNIADWESSPVELIASASDVRWVSSDFHESTPKYIPLIWTTGAGKVKFYGKSVETTDTFSLAGIENLIFRIFKPDYDLVHYHWRNDDGSEAAATSATSGVQDTALSDLGLNTVARLRIEVSNEGGINGISAQKFRLEYGKKDTTCGAISSWTDIADNGGDWDMSASQLTEAGDTTDISSSSLGGMDDENISFLTPNGGQRESTSQTGEVTLNSNQFVNLEYAIKAIGSASENYCFRVTNAGSNTNFSYSEYPEASIKITTMTLSVDAGSSVEFGSLAYGTRKTDNTRLKIDTNETSGYLVSVGRQWGKGPANATLASNANSTIYINDTENGIDVFDGLGSNCTDANGARIWPDSAGVSTGLGFTVWKADINKDTACWGTGTTVSNSLNKYAAFPASPGLSIISTTSNSPNPSFASIGYSLEIKQNQRATSYTGSVIYTATAPP